MSALEIYYVAADGDVEWLGEVRNPHGGAPWIWRVLSAKYGVDDPFQYSNSNSDKGEALWKLHDSGRLTEAENTLLGWTFDAVWVKRENVPRLVAAVEAWWPDNRKQWSEFDHKFFDVTPTLPGMVEVLKNLPADARGVCFNQTSARPAATSTGPSTSTGTTPT